MRDLIILLVHLITTVFRLVGSGGLRRTAIRVVYGFLAPTGKFQAGTTTMSAPATAATHVYAGTINQSGLLEVRTTGIGRDTAFGKIINAVEEAEKSRAPIQRPRTGSLAILFTSHWDAPH